VTVCGIFEGTNELVATERAQAPGTGEEIVLCLTNVVLDPSVTLYKSICLRTVDSQICEHLSLSTVYMHFLIIQLISLEGILASG
jgi:hypothetical protein